MARTPAQLQAAINRGKKGGGTQGALERGEALIERGRMGGGLQGEGEVKLGKKIVADATRGHVGTSAGAKRRAGYNGSGYRGRN